MIVCVCNRVSDRDIRRLAQDGCPNFDELQMATGVATCCGQCEGCARDTFSQASPSPAGATCFVRKDDALTDLA
jgi:bacterioferritin-associated ferredoxin